MTEIWSRLGIPPTSDQAALRLAYAGRLKQVRPDVDPEGFRALREAFEAARRMAGDTAAAPAFVPARPVPPSAPPALSPAPSAAPAIRRDLAEGRLLDAARDWNQAVATGQLGFNEELVLQEEIARAMVAAPAVDLAALDKAARLMDWPAAARMLKAPASVVDVMARRDAAAWLAGMKRQTEAGWLWSFRARKRRRAARLLLRPAPSRLSRWFPYRLGSADFSYWLKPLAVHRRWLGKTIHPARVEWCVASTRRIDVWLVRVTGWILTMWLPLMVAAPFIAAIIRAFSDP